MIFIFKKLLFKSILIYKNWKENGISDSKKSLNFLKKYKWSSYLDFLGVKRKENKILDLDYFPDYFLKNKKFQKEILEWISPMSDIGKS
jgi:hypothetical protein